MRAPMRRRGDRPHGPEGVGVEEHWRVLPMKRLWRRSPRASTWAGSALGSLAALRLGRHLGRGCCSHWASATEDVVVGDGLGLGAVLHFWPANWSSASWSWVSSAQSGW